MEARLLREERKLLHKEKPKKAKKRTKQKKAKQPLPLLVPFLLQTKQSRKK